MIEISDIKVGDIVGIGLYESEKQNVKKGFVQAHQIQLITQR